MQEQAEREKEILQDLQQRTKRFLERGEQLLQQATQRSTENEDMARRYAATRQKLQIIFAEIQKQLGVIKRLVISLRHKNGTLLREIEQAVEYEQHLLQRLQTTLDQLKGKTVHEGLGGNMSAAGSATAAAMGLSLSEISSVKHTLYDFVNVKSVTELQRQAENMLEELKDVRRLAKAILEQVDEQYEEIVKGGQNLLRDMEEVNSGSSSAASVATRGSGTYAIAGRSPLASETLTPTSATASPASSDLSEMERGDGIGSSGSSSGGGGGGNGSSGTSGSGNHSRSERGGEGVQAGDVSQRSTLSPSASMSRPVSVPSNDAEIRNMSNIVLNIASHDSRIQHILGNPVFAATVNIEDLKRTTALLPQHQKELEGLLENIVSNCSDIETRYRRFSDFYRSAVHTYEKLDRTAPSIPNKVVQIDELQTKFHNHMVNSSGIFEEIKDLTLWYIFFQSSYENLLLEIQRRHQEHERQRSIVDQYRKQISQMYEEEEKKRTLFFEEFGRYLPASLCPSIMEKSTRFEITPSDITSKLPKIQLSEEEQQQLNAHRQQQQQQENQQQQGHSESEEGQSEQEQVTTPDPESPKTPPWSGSPPPPPPNV